MQEQVTRLETECQTILRTADSSNTPVIRAWLNGDQAAHQKILDGMRAQKARAAMQAKATWYAWRHVNVLKDDELAEARYEDLAEVSLTNSR